MEKISSREILKSGWGYYFILAGVFSVIMDLISPTVTVGSQNVPVFAPGSFILGWILLVAFMILPAIGARKIGLAPMHGFFAAIWTFVAYFLWTAVNLFLSEGSSGPKGGLMLLGGVVLCWRLLTKRPKPQESQVTEQAPDDSRDHTPSSPVAMEQDTPPEALSASASPALSESERTPT